MYWALLTWEHTLCLYHRLSLICDSSVCFVKGEGVGLSQPQSLLFKREKKFGRNLVLTGKKVNFALCVCCSWMNISDEKLQT